MHKQLIGVFRLVLFFVLIFTFNVSLDPFELKMSISDMIHGGHTAELRNTTSVWIVNLLILGATSFYIIQSLLYIFIGGALNGRNTSIFNFIRHCFIGFRDMGKDSKMANTGKYNNIERVLSYRDSKMAMMSNEQGADFMMGTGNVDLMLSRPDLKQSSEVLSYMNNKIAMMDNETALKYIKGQK